MKKVGFIGLGTMGKPMARNLLKAGYTLTVYDVVPAPIEELAGEGATAATSPREVAEKSDIVLASLPDTPYVEEALLGPNGVAEGAKPGLIVVDHSTIAPKAAENLAAELEKRGLHFLDAPVSGGDIGARDGTLTIMVGGKEEVFNDSLEILNVVGKRITRVGDSGAGQIAKVCTQIVTVCTIAGIGEALTLAAKAGADLDNVLKVLQTGGAACWTLDVRAPNLIKRNFQPGFRARLQYKDVNIALQSGEDYAVSLPVTGAVRELYAAMIEAGRGDLDASALMTVIEDMAHIKVGEPGT